MLMKGKICAEYASFKAFFPTKLVKLVQKQKVLSYVMAKNKIFQTLVIPKYVGIYLNHNMPHTMSPRKSGTKQEKLYKGWVIYFRQKLNCQTFVWSATPQL